MQNWFRGAMKQVYMMQGMPEAAATGLAATTSTFPGGMQWGERELERQNTTIVNVAIDGKAIDPALMRYTREQQLRYNVTGGT